jgi:aspartyl-tRNA(Asn)/glutamyl-tRNA(Gln) amidotransferase subunit A
MDDLFYLPATEALESFRAKTLSPVGVMTAVIERAEAVEPKINAFMERLFDQALERAKQAESRYSGRGDPPRPLEGIPVAIKEEHPIAGHSWSSGCVLGKDVVAEVTHPIVERIVAAGGIIHARTTTPEFSCAGFTHTELWGVTHNPWRLDRTPGGSSGGSGAALAAGATALATGSDIGGSIRIPASLCGVVGFKPPYGRVPAMPPFNLDHYNHDGPLARTVADCALLQNVIVGPHAGDIASLRPAALIPDQLGGIEGWKVALCINLGDYPVEPDVVENTRAVGGALRQVGAVVEEIELDWTMAEISLASWIHYATIFAPSVRLLLGEDLEGLMPYTIGFVKQAEAIAKEHSYYEGLEIEGRLTAELGALLEQFDVLVCPTTSSTSVLAGDDYVGKGMIVDGQELDSYYDTMMTVPFNIASRCPVLAVPSGRSADGVPTGVQIVGPTYDDERVFRVGAALEQVRPWFGDPAWRPSFQ